MTWMMAQFVAMLFTTPLLHVRAASPKVRPAAVAGAFYPADPAQISSMIDDFLSKAALPPVDGTILAAVAPHAGYQYSGPVAAYTYAALKGHKYSRVVVIAPSHYVGFDFTSIYDGDAYTTPLGEVKVDKEFASKLAAMSSTMQLSDKGHQATSNAPEHSVEVQLPWLQKILGGNFQIVPIVMGDQSYEASRALGVALSKLIHDGGQEGGTLVLASSDMSHYHTYDDAETIDHKTLNALQLWDYFSMSRNFQYRTSDHPQGIWEACGGAPIVAAMIYAERMGASQAEVLRYANSGDVTSDRSRVVGYSADLFLKTTHASAAETPFSLTDAEKSELLALARKSAEYAVTNSSYYTPPASQSATLNREYGAFVTITKAGDLRGCIGYTSPTKPLYLTVRDTAALAALRDPRFSPVAVAELPSLAYEVSVLSPLRRVTDVAHIKVGEHGLIMKNGDSEGLLLPQVPVEQHWDRQTFLEQTCKKAGMNTNCWKDENTDIFSFTAVVFNEHEK